jgi:hypothetical protein
LVAVIGLAAIIAASAFLVLRDRTPPLTRELLAARKAQWKSQGLLDYRIRYTIRIEAQGTTQDCDVLVRAGAVASFRLDGDPRPANEHYSVDGLFDILERELEMVEGKGGAAQGLPQGTSLKARFDERRGLPLEFKRIAPRRKSTFLHVLEFEASPAGEEAKDASR